MGWLESRPESLKQEIFIKLFESAEIAKLDKDKRLQYETEMYTERDRYAEEEYMKDNNVPVETISLCTGLSVEEVNNL